MLALTDCECKEVCQVEKVGHQLDGDKNKQSKLLIAIICILHSGCACGTDDTWMHNEQAANGRSCSRLCF